MMQTQFARYRTDQGWCVPVYGAGVCCKSRAAGKTYFSPRSPRQNGEGETFPFATGHEGNSSRHGRALSILQQLLFLWGQMLPQAHPQHHGRSRPAAGNDNPIPSHPQRLGMQPSQGCTKGHNSNISDPKPACHLLLDTDTSF